MIIVHIYTNKALSAVEVQPRTPWYLQEQWVDISVINKFLKFDEREKSLTSKTVG